MVCCVLFLKIVPKSSHNLKINILSENCKKNYIHILAEKMLEFEISVNICKKVQKKWKLKHFFTQNKENVCEKQPITILVADLNWKMLK